MQVKHLQKKSSFSMPDDLDPVDAGPTPSQLGVHS